MQYVYAFILPTICLVFMSVVTLDALNRAAASNALALALQTSFENYLRTQGRIDPAYVCHRR